jgi:hypothetical protein
VAEPSSSPSLIPHLSLRSFIPSSLPSSLRPQHGRRPDLLLWRPDPRTGGSAPRSTGRSGLLPALAAFSLGDGRRAHGLVAAASFEGGHGGGVRHLYARLGHCVGATAVAPTATAAAAATACGTEALGSAAATAAVAVEQRPGSNGTHGGGARDARVVHGGAR